MGCLSGCSQYWFKRLCDRQLQPVNQIESKLIQDHVPVYKAAPLSLMGDGYICNHKTTRRYTEGKRAGCQAVASKLTLPPYNSECSTILHDAVS